MPKPKEVIHDHTYWRTQGDHICAQLLEEHGPIDTRNILCYAIAELCYAHGYNYMEFLGLTIHSLNAAFLDTMPLDHGE